MEGIAEVRDETDRTGLRIVVELKKDANAQGVLHFFIKIQICKYLIILTWLLLLKTTEAYESGQHS